jgi:alginate O-acetyltransferase complex protein AlgI
MLFNSFVFLFLFLPITYAVFWRLQTASSRYVWLTVTGYIFYGYWDPRFCILMAFSTAVSFTAGLAFSHCEDQRRRKLCLIVPITVDLLLLGFFKYTNFILSATRDAVSLFGLRLQIPLLDIVLPVGISFYTFHTITYVVDCYRRIIRPTRKFFEFAAYVSLFSQLVAGPIVRFRQIERDLETLGSADRRRWMTLGIAFFLWGLVEKTIMADSLAAFVDPALARYETLSTFSVWLIAVCYTFQLYFDFSGYSTMAVGLGYLFGLRIPQNFNSPYKAIDPSDFWRRWHISLSTCLRDYVYIPLGGNQDSRVTYRNLMLTMLIGGLWHGANWTFVLWGAYHGILLALYRYNKDWWETFPSLIRQALLFMLVMVGWVFFRANNLTMATNMLARMFIPTHGVSIENVNVCMVLVLISGLWAMVGPNAFEFLRDFNWKARYAFILSVVFGVCLAIMAGGRNSPFLYFQF